MNDFKDCYQSAMQDMNVLGMKEVHIDVSDCMNERKHKRRVTKRIQRVTTAAFSAACVIFVCGFGTIRAAEYIQNVIRVNEWGFESGDAKTMALNSEGKDVRIIGEEVELASDSKITVVAAGEQASSVPKAETVETEKESAVPEMASELGGHAIAEASIKPGPEMKTDVTVSDNSAGTGSVSGNSSINANSSVSGNSSVGDTSAQSNITVLEEVQIEELPVYNYSSWEEFRKNEDIIFPQPSISIGKNIEGTDITVCGGWAMIRYNVDGKVLWVERTDYADTQGHTSSKVFPEGVCNERQYATPQGYTYTLVDSVKRNDKEQLRIHAAATVGSYETYVDFMGFTEEDAKRIIDNIDLSLYE